MEGICKSIVAQCQGMGVLIAVDQDEPPIIKPKLKI